MVSPPAISELAATLVAKLGSQEKLAEAIGTSQSTVSGWISGGGATDVAELALLRLFAAIEDREKILGAFLAVRVGARAASFEIVRCDYTGANLTARRIDTIFAGPGGKFRELEVVRSIATELAAFDLVVDGDVLVFRRLEDRFSRPGADRVVTFNLNNEDLSAGLAASWRKA